MAIQFKPTGYAPTPQPVEQFGNLLSTMEDRRAKNFEQTQLALDYYGTLPVALGDTELRDLLAQEAQNAYTSLVDSAAGGYYNPQFELRARGLTRELVRDPRIQVLAETARNAELYNKAQQTAELEGRKLLFAEGPPRTNMISDTEWAPGRYTGQKQLDWLGKAEQVIGRLAPDSTDGGVTARRRYFQAFGDYINMLEQKSWRGVSPEKAEERAQVEELMKYFMNSDEGVQMLRFEEQMLGRPMSEEERKATTVNFLTAVAKRQVSDNISIQRSYPEFMNRHLREAEPEDPMYARIPFGDHILKNKLSKEQLGFAYHNFVEDSEPAYKVRSAVNERLTHDIDQIVREVGKQWEVFKGVDSKEDWKEAEKKWNNFTIKGGDEERFVAKTYELYDSLYGKEPTEDEFLDGSVRETWRKYKDMVGKVATTIYGTTLYDLTSDEAKRLERNIITAAPGKTIYKFDLKGRDFEEVEAKDIAEKMYEKTLYVGSLEPFSGLAAEVGDPGIGTADVFAVGKKGERYAFSRFDKDPVSLASAQFYSIGALTPGLINSGTILNKKFTLRQDIREEDDRFVSDGITLYEADGKVYDPPKKLTEDETMIFLKTVIGDYLDTKK